MYYKYICFDDDSFIIFGDFLTHTEMSNVRLPHKPVSAGFVYIGKDKYECEKFVPYGEVASLGLKVDEKDDLRLNGAPRF